MPVEQKLSLWVFKAQKYDVWFIELENEDKGVILRSFSDPSEAKNKQNAICFGNLVGEILGIPCVECGARGL